MPSCCAVYPALCCSFLRSGLREYTSCFCAPRLDHLTEREESEFKKKSRSSRDACLRRVTGWHLAAQMFAELVLLALEQAMTLHLPGPDILVHADRGGQYTSAACCARIEQAGGLPSFSQLINPYNNASAKVDRSTIKTKLLPGRSPFASVKEARLEVAWYFDTGINMNRCQSALVYRAPHRFEKDLNTILPWLTVRFY